MKAVEKLYHAYRIVRKCCSVCGDCRRKEGSAAERRNEEMKEGRKEGSAEGRNEGSEDRKEGKKEGRMRGREE